MTPEQAKELNDKLETAMQSMVPKELKDKGWRYIDPPTKFSYEMWDYFLALIGEGEYQLLISSQGIAADGFKWKRGQFFVSPQGMLNLADKERRARLTPNGNQEKTS